MRIVFALDKYKGTFSAQEACELVAEGVRSRNPKIELILKPMADGGEGSASILAGALGMESMRVQVADLLGKRHDAYVHWQNSRRLAVIESSELLGVKRALPSEDVLFRSSTFGVGQLIQKALELRPLELWIGIGGTLTADLGWGLASAFGLKAFDAEGNRLEPSLANMEKVVRLEPPSELPEFLGKTKVTALCDVAAPAHGPFVSLTSFLSQKGAGPTLIASMEKKMTTFWTQLRVGHPHIPKLEDAYLGSGGGLCLGLSAIFPNLTMELGAQKIARAIALGTALHGASVVVCGEGCLDEMTLYGKAASVVAQVAADHRCKVYGVFGRAMGPVDDLRQKLGLEKYYLLFEQGALGSTKDIIKMSRSRFFEIGIDIAHQIESTL